MNYIFEFITVLKFKQFKYKDGLLTTTSLLLFTLTF